MAKIIKSIEARDKASGARVQEFLKSLKPGRVVNMSETPEDLRIIENLQDDEDESGESVAADSSNEEIIEDYTNYTPEEKKEDDVEAAADEPGEELVDEEKLYEDK